MITKESVFKLYEKGIAIIEFPMMGTAYLFYRVRANFFPEDWESIARYMYIEQWYNKNFK